MEVFLLCRPFRNELRALLQARVNVGYDVVSSKNSGNSWVYLVASQLALKYFAFFLKLKLVHEDPIDTFDDIKGWLEAQFDRDGWISHVVNDHAEVQLALLECICKRVNLHIARIECIQPILNVVHHLQARLSSLFYLFF